MQVKLNYLDAAGAAADADASAAGLAFLAFLAFFAFGAGAEAAGAAAEADAEAEAGASAAKAETANKLATKAAIRFFIFVVSQKDFWRNGDSVESLRLTARTVCG